MKKQKQEDTFPSWKPNYCTSNLQYNLQIFSFPFFSFRFLFSFPNRNRFPYFPWPSILVVSASHTEKQKKNTLTLRILHQTRTQHTKETPKLHPQKIIPSCYFSSPLLHISLGTYQSTTHQGSPTEKKTTRQIKSSHRFSLKKTNKNTPFHNFPKIVTFNPWRKRLRRRDNHKSNQTIDFHPKTKTPPFHILPQIS